MSGGKGEFLASIQCQLYMYYWPSIVWQFLDPLLLKVAIIPEVYVLPYHKTSHSWIVILTSILLRYSFLPPPTFSAFSISRVVLKLCPSAFPLVPFSSPDVASLYIRTEDLLFSPSFCFHLFLPQFVQRSWCCQIWNKLPIILHHAQKYSTFCSISAHHTKPGGRMLSYPITFLIKSLLSLSNIFLWFFPNIAP